MDIALFYLTLISSLFLVGLLVSLLSKALKTSDVFLLVVAGFIIGEVCNYFNIPAFPRTFVNLTAILALSLIIFDGASRLKFKEFDTFSFSALKLFLIFISLNFLVLTPIVRTLFKLNLLQSLIFSNLMSATAFEVLSIMLKRTNKKDVEILTLESLINAPFTVIIPFLLVEFFRDSSKFKTLSAYAMPFLQEIVSGIGAGVLIGLITFKLMRKSYSESLSPIALFTSVILAYVTAEQLGGSGVLAVTVLGLFFGNSYIKKKRILQEFSETMANTIKILVFILFGMSINLPKDPKFLGESLIVFLIYLLVRFLSVEISLPKMSLKEKLFSTLVTPKGITLATVALTLSSMIPSFEKLNNLLFLMFVYSLITSLISVHRSEWFFNKNLERVTS